MGPDSSPVVFMSRDAHGTGARGVVARCDGKGKRERAFSLPITPPAPVLRALHDMKATGNESGMGHRL